MIHDDFIMLDCSRLIYVQKMSLHISASFELPWQPPGVAGDLGMKITVRPIKGESFVVEVPETDTIESLKHLAYKQLQAATSSHKQPII